MLGILECQPRRWQKCRKVSTELGLTHWQMQTTVLGRYAQLIWPSISGLRDTTITYRVF